MSNGFNVFGLKFAETEEVITKSIEVLERKLDSKLIKERNQGSTKLSYIGGHTVIRLLNEAFGYRWSFEIVSDEIVPSQPKINKYKPLEEPEAQPPVVKVLGRLTVPGFGVKEQYGSKVLIGGASEQESTFKSASTDALKKCATMFGIGLELYDDDDDTTSATTATTVEPKPSYSQGNKSTYQKPAINKPAIPQVNAPAASTSYEAVDIEKIKKLKEDLGVPHDDNSKLDPYVREFLDSGEVTFKDITPSNIKAFNVFLSKKATNV
jgi:recombination DNA repair RAD52 pathway protein